MFDAYDDSVELQRFAYAHAPFVPNKQRISNRERMVEIGVWDRKDDGSGYMMKVQPMMRLIAGGIYQNRWAIDAGAARITELETEVERLKELVEA